MPHLRGLPLTSSTSNAYVTRASWLLHIVAKTFAGVGVLDFVDNGGVWLRLSNPSGALRAFTGIGFTLFVRLLFLPIFLYYSPCRTSLMSFLSVLHVQGLTSDPIFGATLVYDLIALYVGQSGDWKTQLGWMAGATTVAVGMKSMSLLGGSGRGPSAIGGRGSSGVGLK